MSKKDTGRKTAAAAGQRAVFRFGDKQTINHLCFFLFRPAELTELAFLLKKKQKKTRNSRVLYHLPQSIEEEDSVTWKLQGYRVRCVLGRAGRGDIIIIMRETWRDSRKIRISQRYNIRVACCRLVLINHRHTWHVDDNDISLVVNPRELLQFRTPIELWECNKHRIIYVRGHFNILGSPYMRRADRRAYNALDLRSAYGDGRSSAGRRKKVFPPYGGNFMQRRAVLHFDWLDSEFCGFSQFSFLLSVRYVSYIYVDGFLLKQRETLEEEKHSLENVYLLEEEKHIKGRGRLLPRVGSGDSAGAPCVCTTSHPYVYY